MISLIQAPARLFWLRYVAWTLAVVVGCFTVFGVAILGILSVENRFVHIPPRFNDRYPLVGDTPPDFNLVDLNGYEVNLSDLTGDNPILIEFGSASCPYCTMQIDGMNELVQRYGDQVDFVFVYTAEAHPQEVYDPKTMAERTERARRIDPLLSDRWLLLVDQFGKDSAQKGFAALENSIFVLHPNGQVAMKYALKNYSQIDRDLSQFLCDRARLTDGAR